MPAVILSSTHFRLRFIAVGMNRTLAVLFALVLVGCEKDEIRHYQAARLEIPPDALAPSVPVPTRMLTAIFPQPNQERTWFFKLTGPPDEVEKFKNEYEQFLYSVRFTKKGDPPLTYTVPQGWQREGGAGMRFASFRFGSKEKPLELTITPLGREAGTRLDNVNRWRNQLGLKPVDEEEMTKSIRKMDVDGVKATLVDLTGEMSVKGKMNAPFANRQRPIREREKKEPSDQLPFKYQTPPGWKELPARDGISLVAFQIDETHPDAMVTISSAGGSMIANVNRWRAQVDLEPISQEKIENDLRPMAVGGLPGHYIDLTGPGGKRILAVMVPREDTTWFFKMRGPAELVGRQKSAFESFVSSVRFMNGNGAKK
jgi:hypothetical protein